jgi:hypothetical protein
MLESL